MFTIYMCPHIYMYNHYSLLITKSYAINNWLKPEHVNKIKETFYDPIWLKSDLYLRYRIEDLITPD